MFKNPLKKAGAAALCAALCASLTIPAFAAPASSVTIHMDRGGIMPMGMGVEGTGTFGAYRILDLKTSLKEGDTCDGAHTESCYNYAYSINSKYQDVLNTAAAEADTDSDSVVSTEELLSYLGGMTSDSDEIRAFADDLYGEITTASLGVDATADGSGSFTSIAQGYYLIAETGLGTSPDSRSLVMLDTAGQLEITVEAKEDVPTLTKTVADTGSSSFVESVMAGVGEEVTFKLEGTLPSTFAHYETYAYTFHDTLPAGLTYKTGSVQVMVGDVDVTDQFTVDTSCEDSCTIAFSCADLKDAALASANLSASSKITLTYVATVASDNLALGNPGNINSAVLEFSNDPYDTSATDKTPADQATVFSTSLEVTKTDGSNNPLSGAGFTLSKWDENSSSYVALSAASVAGNVHTFSGLGDGQYKLEETTVPDGYNKADDIIFVIGDETFSGDDAKVAQTLTSFTVEDTDGTAIDEMTVSGTKDKVSVTIQNLTGSLLPSTGGSGTYVIYGSAAVLLVGGAILFVMKRKKNENA